MGERPDTEIRADLADTVGDFCIHTGPIAPDESVCHECKQIADAVFSLDVAPLVDRLSAALAAKEAAEAENERLHRAVETVIARLGKSEWVVSAELSRLLAAATPCRHCGQLPDADGDHSCPCPHRDEDCPEHPLASSTCDHGHAARHFTTATETGAIGRCPGPALAAAAPSEPTDVEDPRDDPTSPRDSAL